MYALCTASMVRDTTCVQRGNRTWAHGPLQSRGEGAFGPVCQNPKPLELGPKAHQKGIAGRLTLLTTVTLHITSVDMVRGQKVRFVCLLSVSSFGPFHKAYFFSRGKPMCACVCVCVFLSLYFFFRKDLANVFFCVNGPINLFR